MNIDLPEILGSYISASLESSVASGQIGINLIWHSGMDEDSLLPEFFYTTVHYQQVGVICQKVLGQALLYHYYRDGLKIKMAILLQRNLLEMGLIGLAIFIIEVLHLVKVMLYLLDHFLESFMV